LIEKLYSESIARNMDNAETLLSEALYTMKPML